MAFLSGIIAPTNVITANTAVTLTNKTLTAPVINSPTGIVKGDVGLGNVDNTSDATKNSATATLTNKTIDYANNTLTNVVGVTATQTLTNKTLTAPTIASANLTTALTLAGAAGTNGQVLTSAGSGLPSWTTPASPSALTLLSTVTASNSTTVDIETTFSSTYDAYIIVASGVTASTSINLLSRFKVAGSYVTAATYDNHIDTSSVSSGAAVYASSTNLSEIRIASSLQFASTDSFDFTLHIHTPSSTALYKKIYWIGASNDGLNLNRHDGIGMLENTGAVTGVRFLTTTGTIVAGNFRLYGIANS